MRRRGSTAAPVLPESLQAELGVWWGRWRGPGSTKVDPVTVDEWFVDLLEFIDRLHAHPAGREHVEHWELVKRGFDPAARCGGCGFWPGFGVSKCRDCRETDLR